MVIDGDCFLRARNFGVMGNFGMAHAAQVWSIVIQICQALKYIHVNRGVVHRDLTPANILIQQRDLAHHTELRVKLADFGLAKRKGGASLMSSAVGTMPYSCPEIIQHEVRLSPSPSDVCGACTKAQLAS
jgi:serine/threonine protein kinase